MSEFEIMKRKQYKRNRKKWLVIQIIAAVLLAAVTLGCFVTYNRMDRTYYVSYFEKSDIDYKVQYAENDFFAQEWIGEDQAYISTLIDAITADFTYRLSVDSSDMRLEYQYSIDQQLLIASTDNGTPYFSKEENIFRYSDATVKEGSTLSIKDSVGIDYKKYDALAREFVKTYNLQDVSCTLIVSLNVDVASTNKLLGKTNENVYTTSLHIPLAADTFNIHSTSSVPADEVQVMEYRDTANKNFFRTVGTAAAILTVLMVLTIAIFLRLTQNEDITYTAKVRRILSAYGSFIQRMNGEFDYSGYQLVPIKTFTEMLGIRDTLQAPILMSTNRDETMSRFFIPTDGNLLYIFDIKVDNYDQLYGRTKEHAHSV